MPQNLENLLKSGIFKRLLIRIEKDEHKDAVFGTLSLNGKNAEKKIMVFKLGRYDYKLEKQLSPEYIYYQKVLSSLNGRKVNSH